jgi:hypothetical protein
MPESIYTNVPDTPEINNFLFKRTETYLFPETILLIC